jgi:hypothetical protein
MPTSILLAGNGCTITNTYTMSDSEWKTVGKGEKPKVRGEKGRPRKERTGEGKKGEAKPAPAHPRRAKAKEVAPTAEEPTAVAATEAVAAPTAAVAASESSKLSFRAALLSKAQSAAPIAAAGMCRLAVVTVLHLIRAPALVYSCVLT